VSGDGVEQDDSVTAGGARGFEVPAAIRADQVVLRGVRLPYWLFPRNPEQLRSFRLLRFFFRLMPGPGVAGARHSSGYAEAGEHPPHQREVAADHQHQL
jgi:hypothetical protein